MVSESNFFHCFEELIGDDISDEDREILPVVLGKMYELFDTNEDGVVDFTELGTGLTPLVGGSKDEKAKAAFDLYDYNGDGVISLDEMTRYLTAVFKVMYAAESGTEAKMGCDAGTLAMVTAEQAFKGADLNHDGKLSFGEFQNWYSSTQSGAAAQQLEEVAESQVTLADIRRVTGLEKYTINEVLELFAAATDGEGYVSESNFFNCFEQLIGDDISDDDKEILPVVLGKMYELFDTNNDGVLDFTELGTGLTPLVGGSQDEKAKAAFDLYDYNGDGVISLEEMTRYLTAVFKVMFAAESGTEAKMGCDAGTLAMVTAEQAFKGADLNHDGKLSFAEFQNWYSSTQSGAAAQQLEEVAESQVTLADIRRVTGLEKYTINEVLELFAAITNEEVYVSESDFFDCFKELIGDDISDDDMDILPVVLGKLYDLFDTNNDGVVDFTELGT